MHTKKFTCEQINKSTHIWKVLIVDDTPDIHIMTKMNLKDFEFENKKIEFISAYNGSEAIDILKRDNDIALVLLDVVMETPDAGLVVVKKIREDLNNNFISIILRTSDTQNTPENEIITKFKINGYLEKNELGTSKLFSQVVTAIRTYQDLQTISETKKTLEKSNNSLLKAQEIANIGNWEFDLTTKKLFCSKQIYNIYNIDSNDCINTLEELSTFIHPCDKNMVNAIYTDSLRDIKNYTIEYRLLLNNQTIKYVEEKCTYEYSDKDETLKSNGIIHDITDKKIYENKVNELNNIMTQQSKMASMGNMIENITHQWRQPLSIIDAISVATKLKNNSGDLELKTIDNSMDIISNQIHYLSQTIDDFGNFFKPNKIKAVYFIKQTFEKTNKLMESVLKNNNIKLISDIQDIELYGFENELIQVIINLFNNAKDALKICDINTKLLFVTVIKKDSMIEICIKDNAGGIPKNDLNKVFDSYYTTKKDSKGTGIGLYMSKIIIEEHMNGNISINNTKYNYKNSSHTGAEIKINIPISI